jgi:hypothetical protein
MKAGTKIGEVGQLTHAFQSKPFGTLTLPRHLHLSFLSEVVTHGHVLPEILHGTVRKHTGFIESHHDSNHA